MKHVLLFVALVASARAQWIVHDPVNTAVNSAVQAGQAANHLEVLRQWAAQLEQLNRQLRELEAQLAVQERIRDVMGDPSAAGAGLTLRELGANDLARTYGETLATARRLANVIDSLQRTADGIYRPVDDRTVLGREFTRQDALYRRYAAVERQADNLTLVQHQTGERVRLLQADLAATLEQMRTAGTQAEVDKLNGKIAALNGQLARLDAPQRNEAEKLRAQQILNENQAAKERQDLLETQLAEERQSLGVVGAWQQSLTLTPTNFNRP
jgi:hypothetical protein